MKGIARWRQEGALMWGKAVAAEKVVAHRIHDGWEVAVPKAKRMARNANRRLKAASPHMAKAGRHAAKGMRRLFA